MAIHILCGFGRFKFDLANITVEPVLFLYMFSSFLYLPTLQALIFKKVCLSKYISEFCEELQSNETFKDEHKKEADKVTSESSFWMLKINIALTVSSFIVVVLFLGALGDSIGRKVPVILPCLGNFAASLAAILNAKYMSASLNYLLIGPVLNGLSGGYIACLMAVYSFVGHISSPRSKMTRVSILESMVFLAATIGIFVSGVMLDSQGLIFTFSSCCIAVGIAFVYALVWLDNVRPQEMPREDLNSRRQCEWLFKYFRDSFTCIMRPRERAVLPALILQVLVLDILMLCTSGDIDITYFYVKKTFDFTPTLFGYYKGLDNFLRGIILVTFLPLLKRYTGVSDLPLVMLGLVSYAAGFILLGTSVTKWMVFLAAVVGAFKGIPSAGLRTTMSSMVSNGEQGRLFGLIAASESIIALVASVLFNQLYPATMNMYPSPVYLLGAGLILIALGVITYLYCTIPVTTVEAGYRSIEENVNQAQEDDFPWGDPEV